MGTSYQLTAAAREKVGKGAARAVRREGQIPAVIYGGNEPPVAISLSDRDVFFKIHGGGFLTTVAEIVVNGETIRTLPRDYQLDPVSDRLVHVDFLRIHAGSKIKVEVPVQFTNELDSPGIKRGGVLNVVRHRVELLCPADSIPDKIVADLTGYEINDSVHISKVTLPEGVRPTIDRDFTIATIAAPAGLKEDLRQAAAGGGADGKADDAKKPDAAKKPEAAKKPDGGKK